MATTLQGAPSQPATGIGSLAMTNQLIANAQQSQQGSSGSSYNPQQVAQINAARQANVDAGRNAYTGAGATDASNAAGKENTLVTPFATTPTIAPTTPPVNTNQPSPTKVNATPYTNPTDPVVSAAEAQANLTAGGLTGSGLAAAKSNLSAYQQGHNAANASGVSAPQDAGTGMSAATTATGNATQTYTPPAPVLDALAKATKQYTDDYAKYMTSQSQGETLVQQYQDISKQLGIPELNTQLINMKNVIDGTEQDIRNEVTKAGGFATDSQVLALTNARNKVMIQNYNNLLQTKSDAMTQLTTLTGLAAQDRTFAAEQIDKQLNFDQQQITFATNAQKNAQESIQKSIDNYGAAQVLKQALATGDPTAVARINATMGNGFDLHTAALAGPTLDEQVKLANIAQSKASIAASNASIAKDNATAAATKTAKAAAVTQGANSADTVLGAVSKAMKQVNPASSGFIGGVSSAIPSSPSNNLQSTITTIKSNLAFTELAKMRAASPTGGALGAISDKEEELLSSTVANLGVNQSTSQLKDNLTTVQDHYISYLQSLGYGYDAATGTVISP